MLTTPSSTIMMAFPVICWSLSPATSRLLRAFTGHAITQFPHPWQEFRICFKSNCHLITSIYLSSESKAFFHAFDLIGVVFIRVPLGLLQLQGRIFPAPQYMHESFILGAWVVFSPGFLVLGMTVRCRGRPSRGFTCLACVLVDYEFTFKGLCYCCGVNRTDLLAPSTVDTEFWVDVGCSCDSGVLISYSLVWADPADLHYGVNRTDSLYICRSVPHLSSSTYIGCNHRACRAWCLVVYFPIASTGHISSTFHSTMQVILVYLDSPVRRSLSFQGVPCDGYGVLWTCCFTGLALYTCFIVYFS